MGVRTRLALAVGLLGAMGCVSRPPGLSDAGSADRRGVVRPVSSSPDACAAQPPPACPVATVTEGAGLLSLDRCAFALQEGADFESAPPLIAALESLAPRVGVGEVLEDLNRTGASTAYVPGSPAGIGFAFTWSARDLSDPTWIPQGITGSPDATATGWVEGKRVLLVSWYQAPGSPGPRKGIRVAFVDTSGATDPRYRFVLLVAPTGTVAAPDFAPIPLHAGGIAWVGNLLYVVDTLKGFRVFDLTHILRVRTDEDRIGCDAGGCRAGLYQYALPQIGSYTTASPCAPRFSFVSLDRTSTPPALVSGEYCDELLCETPLAGRVFRWPVSLATGRLGTGRFWPSEADLIGQTQVQGAASHAGRWLFSSSAPSGQGGALYRVGPQGSAVSGWVDTPEDLMLDATHHWIYGLSEGRGTRTVFAADLDLYLPP